MTLTGLELGIRPAAPSVAASLQRTPPSGSPRTAEEQGLLSSPLQVIPATPVGGSPCSLPLRSVTWGCDRLWGLFAADQYLVWKPYKHVIYLSRHPQSRWGRFSPRRNKGLGCCLRRPEPRNAWLLAPPASAASLWRRAPLGTRRAGYIPRNWIRGQLCGHARIEFRMYSGPLGSISDLVGLCELRNISSVTRQMTDDIWPLFFFFPHLFLLEGIKCSCQSGPPALACFLLSSRH